MPWPEGRPDASLQADDGVFRWISNHGDCLALHHGKTSEKCHPAGMHQGTEHALENFRLSPRANLKSVGHSQQEDSGDPCGPQNGPPACSKNPGGQRKSGLLGKCAIHARSREVHPTHIHAIMSTHSILLHALEQGVHTVVSICHDNTARQKRQRNEHGQPGPMTAILHRNEILQVCSSRISKPHPCMFLPPGAAEMQNSALPVPPPCSCMAF